MSVPQDWRRLPKARASVWLGALLQALVLAGAAEADEIRVPNAPEISPSTTRMGSAYAGVALAKTRCV